MAEFELDRDSVSRAKALSFHLMQDLRQLSEGDPPFDRWELFSERHYAEQAEGVPINDVVANVGQMATEFAIARRRDGKIPFLKLNDGELAPISMPELFEGPPSPFGRSRDWKEFLARHFPFSTSRRWQGAKRGWPREEEVLLFDVPEADELVEHNLSGFLSYRFAGAKTWSEWFHVAGGSTSPIDGRQGSGSSPPGPAVSPGGGLQVQVSCRTAGLRLHVSPSYFVTWTYFGSPTTPVTSYVLPGRYIFAADGPMLRQPRQDNGVFGIPPTYRPVLVSF